MEYIFKLEPVWKIEAVYAMVSHFNSIEERLIENSDKYGLTNEAMYEFLEKYIGYKKAVLNKAMPIFNKKYKKLQPYLVEDIDGLRSPMVVQIIDKHRDILNETLNDETVDYILKRIIDRILYDSLGDEGLNYNFNELSDIVFSLNKTQLSDVVKMNIINFYIDRYNLCRMIVDLTSDIAPICERYFYHIEDEYKKGCDYISNKDNIDKFINQYTNIDTNDAEDMELNINIFFLNRLLINFNAGEKKIFVGYKSIELLELKNNNQYTDTQMVTSLKSMADVTRYKILNMLSKKTMYMQEIANVLELTAANVSHHINMLLQNNIITAVLDMDKNKRIYYELNESEISNLLTSISNNIRKKY